MPEGDTIFRTAARLRPAIEGKGLVRFSAPRLAGSLPQPGETVDAVRSHGKHLLIDFSGGLTLRVHLRMTGSWHLYRSTTDWRAKERAARVVIEVDEWVAVCRSAPDVALTSTDAAATSHLGPDLCQPEPDFDDICKRARQLGPDSTIGEVVMDQRVACGIGNVFKAEALHSIALDPTTVLSRLTDDMVRSVFVEAQRLLAMNLDRPGARVTVPGGYAVYGRAGEACPRCAALVKRIVQGAETPRSTYYCPGCQRQP